MKYKLTKESKVEFRVKLYRVEAIENNERYGVYKGDKGGWIEKESNLSQDGNAWVSGNAQVYGNAHVSGNAQVYGDARVYDDAYVSGNARVSGNAWVSGNAHVSGKLKLVTGLFFGVKWKGEPVKEIEIKNGNYLIGKGDIKLGEEEPSLKGKEIRVELDGKSYTAIIQ